MDPVEPMGGGEAIFILATILSLYFLPTIVAGLRGMRNAVSVFVLNLLLGWTFIAWVIALAWAFTNDREVRR